VLRIALPVSALAVGTAVVDNVAAPFRFLDQLGASPTGYGAYLALWGVGALAGAQILPALGRGREEVSLAAGNALTGVGIAGIGLAPSLSFAFAASVAGGIGNGLVSVAQSALIARRVRQEQTGRAFAAAGAVTQAAIGGGTAAGAPLVQALGADGAMTAAGAFAVVPALAALVVALRRGRGPADQPDQEPV
jgi:predicted MFS family arabinose efflux permease